MDSKNTESRQIEKLELFLNYKFHNIELLKNALRHSSYVNEHSKFINDNERLEFLGDSILSVIISDILMKHYPKLKEGELSRLRASFVNEKQLATIAKKIHTGQFLYLGKGEIETNGRKKDSILACGLEAIIAAVYLDGGFNSSFKLVKTLFYDLISSNTRISPIIDYKSKLQEKSQILFHTIPHYYVIGDHGPDHNKTFIIKMKINKISSKGLGSTKKAAEQDAAKKGLKLLKQKISN